MLCLGFFLSLSGWFVSGVPVRQTVVASKASPWPMPASYVTSSTYQTLDAANFEFRTTGGHSCDLLEAAFVRYYRIIFGGPKSFSEAKGDSRQDSNEVVKFWRKNRNGALSSLDVNLANECEEWPSLKMDESC